MVTSDGADVTDVSPDRDGQRVGRYSDTDPAGKDCSLSDSLTVRRSVGGIDQIKRHLDSKISSFKK